MLLVAKGDTFTTVLLILDRVTVELGGVITFTPLLEGGVILIPLGKMEEIVTVVLVLI